MSKLQKLYDKIHEQTLSGRIKWAKTSGPGFLCAFKNGSVKLEQDSIMNNYTFNLYDNNGGFISGVNTIHDPSWEQPLAKLQNIIYQKEQEKIDKKIDGFLSELE